MLILQGFSNYQIGDFSLKVRDLSVTDLQPILSICSAMDHKVKAQILQIAADQELSSALAKTQTGEDLTAQEILKIQEYSQSAGAPDFSLQECLSLVDAYNCLETVSQGDQPVDLQEFKDAVKNCPKYLKALANLIYKEYKSATEIAELKKT